MARRAFWIHGTLCLPSTSSFQREGDVTKFLLWCILFVLCWPVALLALLLYPIVWLVLIPFRVLGIAVEGVLGLIKGIILLPTRLLNAPR